MSEDNAFLRNEPHLFFVWDLGGWGTFRNLQNVFKHWCRIMMHVWNRKKLCLSQNKWIRPKKKCLYPIPRQKNFESVGWIEILFYFEILFFFVTVATHDDKVDLWDGVADLSNACSIKKRPLFPQESGTKRSFSVQSTRFTSFLEDMLISQGKDCDR